MKKQILFLAIFSLAILAGTTNVYGQLLPGITSPTKPAPLQPITPLSCLTTSEALHPFPGVSYAYSLRGPGPETVSAYTWWATKDTSFVTGAVTMPAGTNTNLAQRLTTASFDLINTSSNYGVTTPITTVGADSVRITWSADILSRTSYQTRTGAPGTAALPTSTFVVGYAQGVNCADNIQVYEINPKPNFTIDIAAIDTAGTAKTLNWGVDTTEVCVDVIRSATYNSATKEIRADYGKNVIYYEVAAQNFVKDWTPYIYVEDGLRTTQTAVISLHKTLAEARSNSAALWTSQILGTGNMDDTIKTVPLTATNIADVATGVSVYVRVLIDNNTEESLSNNAFILAVDGRDNTNTGIWDMEDGDCAALVDEPDQTDRSTITITPRPTLNSNTADGGAPNPTTTVPKPSTTTAPNF